MTSGGAYDDLTLWEQIDSGAQYTPAKKWLTSVPILLFVPRRQLGADSQLSGFYSLHQIRFHLVRSQFCRLGVCAVSQTPSGEFSSQNSPDVCSCIDFGFTSFQLQ